MKCELEEVRKEAMLTRIQMLSVLMVLMQPMYNNSFRAVWTQNYVFVLNWVGLRRLVWGGRGGIKQDYEGLRRKKGLP